MVAGVRTHRLLVDDDGRPVSEISDAIMAATKIVDSPYAKPGQDDSATIDEFFAAKIACGDWEETTKAGHRHIYSSFPKALGKPLLTATTADLQKWYNGRLAKVTESSAQTYFACIASLYRWLFTTGRMAHNPAIDVEIKIPQPAKDREFAHYEQRDEIIKKAKPDMQLSLFLFLGFHFGLRRREIDHARPEWIDLRHRLLRVRNLLKPPEDLRYFRVKNGKERTIPMSKEATAFFRRYMKTLPADAGYLLHPEKKTQGKNRYRYDMRAPFEDHMTACKMEWLTIHGMRTTFASLLATTGAVSIPQIADWIGDTIKVTEDRYAHLIPRHDLMEKAFKHRKR